jgi:hypothetical protein
MKNQLKRIIGTYTILDVYNFEEFQELKINKFEVELGYDTTTKYFYNDENNQHYGEEVRVQDYKLYGLIDQKIFDLNELLEYSDKFKNVEDLISKVFNGEELYIEIKDMVKKYLEKNLIILGQGSILLGDFVIRCLTDGIETEFEKEFIYIS